MRHWLEERTWTSRVALPHSTVPSSRPSPRRGRWRRFSATALLALSLGAPAIGVESPPAEDAVPGDEDATLTGREIYARVLANRFRSFIQESTMESSDRGGKHQLTRLRMHWKDFKQAGEPSSDGVLSKTLVKYFHPFEIRHSGYLVIHNQDRSNDQFVYFPTRRKVVRVSLRSESVYGTDFSFEDILPRELQDASYRRLPDGVVSGRPTFTIEATPTEMASSEYSRFLISVEKERSVVLRTRYWDDADVPVKELWADPVAVRDFGGVWVPMRMTMKHLLHETSTELLVTRIEPNPELSKATFALRRLEAH